MADETVKRTVSLGEVMGVLATALVGVVITRWPVARWTPVEADDFILIDLVKTHWFNVYHTLFIASGRLFGDILGDAYEGFVVLDMVTSALALTAAWWWLRALVRPTTALAATLMLGVSPLFWAYGAMAGSYTGIIAVGSFLLGLAARTRTEPKPWHPFAAAVVLALGTGYRVDIGVVWLSVFFVILWPHRWTRALEAGALFTVLNLTWIALMLHEAGGWTAYRASTREFTYQAGYLNSVWHLGLVDAPVRYSVKLVIALIWTFGPALVVVPRGLARLISGSSRSNADRGLALLLIVAALPALFLHLTVHFGVPGYAFHYAPALLALIALGIAREPAVASADHAPMRLSALALTLGAVFLLYPTDYRHGGLRGDFDLSFARHTRHGLRAPLPEHTPTAWRTANSRSFSGTLIRP